MQNQTRDALLATVEDIFRQCADLARKVRIMERLLSQNSGALYQEYMTEKNDPLGHALPLRTQKLIEDLRQAILRNRE
jgi:hypothetical protein